MFVWCGALSAQTGDGGTESLFSLGMQARTLGMGNAAVAYPLGAGGLFWNPGGLVVVEQKSVALSLTTLFAGTQYAYIGYVHPTLNSGTFAFGITRIGNDGIMVRDWDQNVMQEYGEVGFWWGKLSMAYALRFWGGLSAGLTVDLNRKVLGSFSANGFGLTGGVHYAFPQEHGLLRELRFGLSMENLVSPRLRLGSATETIPPVLRAGLAKTLYLSENDIRWLFLLDVVKPQLRDVRVHLGTEFSLNQLFYLRMGLNYNHLTFGAGLRYGDIQIDYATSQLGDYSFLPWTHRFSLEFYLGRSLADLREEIERRKQEEIQRRFEARLEEDRTQQITKGLRLAREDLDKGDFFNARVELTQVLRLDEGNAAAKQLLAIVDERENVYQAQREQELIQADRERTKREEDNRFIQEKRDEANQALARNDFHGAIDAWEQALKRDPGNAQIKTYLSQARIRLREEVDRQISRARSLVNQDAISQALAALDAAKNQAQGDSVLVNRVEREVRQLNREVDFQHNYQEGTRRFERGDYQGALPYLERARNYKPKNRQVSDMYSLAKAKVGGEDQVLSGRARELYLQGINLYKENKFTEAIKVWEEALKLAPNNAKLIKTIQDVRSYLEKIEKD